MLSIITAGRDYVKLSSISPAYTAIQAIYTAIYTAIYSASFSAMDAAGFVRSFFLLIR